MASASSIDASIPRLQPVPVPGPSEKESHEVEKLVQGLGLLKHIEGGYFAEIDRNPLIIPNPFKAPADTSAKEDGAGRTALLPRSGDDSVRNASTSIFYLLSRGTPKGCFHRNKGRTVHTLIQGRGRYILIHEDEPSRADGKKRIETFVVGKDVANGEKAVWIVEGGKWKASFLLEGDGDGLLISETVIPGFEYSDHDFLTREKFESIVTEEQKEELGWLVRKGEAPQDKDLL